MMMMMSLSMLLLLFWFVVVDDLVVVDFVVVVVVVLLLQALISQVHIHALQSPTNSRHRRSSFAYLGNREEQRVWRCLGPSPRRRIIGSCASQSDRRGCIYRLTCFVNRHTHLGPKLGVVRVARLAEADHANVVVHDAHPRGHPWRHQVPYRPDNIIV